MNVSKKIIIKTVSFFLITEIISLFFIFFLVYPFMGRNFFKLIDEFKVPIVISVVVYIIVCYSLYLLIKPISKLKRSENNKNNEDTKFNIIKIEKIVKIFFTTVNIIGWVVVSSIATISRALLEGFTRWSTVRFILVCFIFGPVIGIIQSLYFSYLMRDVKIDVNIIEFNIKESFFNVKRKIFYNFAVLLLFITLVTTLVTFASIEKTAGISNIAYQLDKNKSEEPEGYFTTLLKKIENTTNLTEIKEEASIIKEQWREKSKYDTLGIIIFVFIVFSLTLAAAYIFASYIYTHLKGINDRLKEISKVEGDITQFLVKTTDDEIGGIQVNINRLLLNLNKNFKTIYDVATTIINKNKEEESSIENLIKLNNEISSISKILNSEIQNQKNVVTATAETIKETVQLLENNKENITSQAAMVEESNASHHQVLKSIELVANNIEEAHKLSTNLENISNNSLIAVSELKTSISDINSIGERISEILTTIFSITDQIDILAMNAAIEAAHAGDAGKGFAVVADEVRKLAENTSVQTQDISKLLKEMTESIKNSVSKSQNMALAFQNISTGVDETTKIINSINIASTELQAAAKENIKATDSLVKITADVMDNLTKEDEFNTKLNETIKQLDLSTENFNNVGQRQADYFINLEKQFENFNVYFKNISEKLKLLESILNKLKLLEENVLSS